jgi:hypothetical protein
VGRMSRVEVAARFGLTVGAWRRHERLHLGQRLAMAKMLLSAADVLDDSVRLADQLRRDAQALGVEALALAELEPPVRAPRPDRRRAQRDGLLNKQATETEVETKHRLG